MAEGLLYVIMDMITLVIENSIGTMVSLLGLSGGLLDSLSAVLGVGGSLGLVIVLVILGLVGFFVFRFFFNTMKNIAILAFVALGILAFLFIGSAII